jgi:hypothetical protein
MIVAFPYILWLYDVAYPLSQGDVNDKDMKMMGWNNDMLKSKVKKEVRCNQNIVFP